MPKAVYILLLLSLCFACEPGAGQDEAAAPRAEPEEQAPAGHDWPTFRGNARQTGVAKDKLPGKLKMLWSHDSQSSYLKSTAAIVGDTVYIGTDEEQLIALDLKTGARRWTYEASDIVEAAPGVKDGRVYVGDLYGVFHCVDARTGELVWKYETDMKIISSANFHGNNVLVGSWDYHLYCFDRRSGDLKWKFENPAQVNCSPCVVGDVAAISGCDGALHLIDLETGEEQASIMLAGYVAASAAYRDGHYYVPSFQGEVFAVAEPDENEELEVVWSEMSDNPDAAFYASPAVTEKFVFFGDRTGVVRCMEREAGDEVWSVQTDGEVDSSPVVSGEHLFVGSSDGNLYSLRLTDGKEAWRFQTGAGIYASPAIGRNRLVIGADDGIIYCFGPGEED
jgi:outer membrane protein assembly factor BamB